MDAVKKFFYVALLLLLFGNSMIAQVLVTVKDKANGKPVANATVISNGTRIFTGNNGKFDLSVFKPSDSLRISHVAYVPFETTYKELFEKRLVLLTRRAIRTGEVKIFGAKPLGEKTEVKELLDLKDENKVKFKTVGDALKKQTLLFVKDYGGLQTVSFRGLSAENTLVLFNEARVNDLQTGTFDFSTFATSSVERIEYLKNSTQGILTAGGVIKIFTDTGAKENLTVLGLGFNSTLSQNYFATVKRRVNKFNFIVSANRSYSPNGYEYYFEGQKHRRQNAFYSKSFLSGELQWQSKYFLLKYYVHYSHLLNGLPGFVVSNNYASEKASSLSDSFLNIVNALFKLTNRSSVKSVLSVNSQSLTLKDPAGSLFFVNKQQHSQFGDFSLMNKYEWNGSNIELTFSHYFNYGTVDNLASAVGCAKSNANAERFENIFAANISKRFKPERLFNDIVVSFGTNYLLINEKIAGKKENRYLANAISLLLKPSFLTGTELILTGKNNYRYPTFNEIFYSGLFPNGELKGEEYRSIDVTLRKVFNSFTADKIELTYFNIFGKNKIIWVPTRLALQIPKNIARIKSEGIELVFKKNVWANKIGIDFRYAFTKTQNISFTKAGDKTYGKQLIYVPLHKAVLNLNAAYCSLSGNVAVQFVSERYFTPDNTEINSLPPYLITDFSLTFKFKFSRVRNFLTLNVYNLFNTKYFVIQSYPMPLRTISINYQMRLK